MAGYFLGGIDQGFAQGFGEGAAIDANLATAGQNADLNSYANSLQGGVYTASRWLGGAGMLGLVAAGLPALSEYAAYGLTYAGSALLEGLGAASEYGGAVWGGGLASAAAIGVGSLENGQLSELAPGLEDLAQSRLSLEGEQVIPQLEQQQQTLASAAPGTTIAGDLTAAANRAAQSVGPGSGPVYGTQVHATFQAEVEALGQSGLQTEMSYLNGAEVPYGTPGSIRIDVGQYSANGQIQSVFDLKTGSATLTAARIQQIQQAVGSQVPVIVIRPNL